MQYSQQQPLVLAHCSECDISPDILQLIEDIARFILDQDGSVGGLEHAHSQFLRKHVDDESMQSIHAANFMGNVYSPRLIPEL